MTARDTRVLAVLVTIAAIALAPACAEEEIVLARLPPSRDGGLAGEAKRCVEDGDCSNNAFCARTECGDVGGACAPRPVVCEEEPAPVCGCDGVTYWNDCLRRAAGVTAKTSGECAPGVGKACGGHRDPGPGPGPGSDRCPAGTYCARLLPSPPPGAPPVCPPDVLGACWALPAVCPPRSGPDRWTACGGPDLRCRATCDAIRSGEPHQRATACL